MSATIHISRMGKIIYLDNQIYLPHKNLVKIIQNRLQNLI